MWHFDMLILDRIAGILEHHEMLRNNKFFASLGLDHRLPD